ncbi:MAG: hypothetical protein K2M11_10475 [Paramuribaculum sp.]|nr:hypothetical protein [Paramuribaculum sp.]
MNNDRFSIARTLNLFRLYFIENRNFFFICAAALTGILICVALSIATDVNYMNNIHKFHELDPAISYLLPIYIVLGYVFAALGASFMFSGLKSKQGRINALMIPALSSEKLVSRMILFVVIYPVFFLVALLFAEFIRYLFMYFKPHEAPVTPLYMVFSNSALLSYCTPVKYPHLIPCMLFVGAFAVQSFFVLGSVMWPKYSALKTFGVFFTLFFLYLISSVTIGEHLSSGRIYQEKPFIERNFPYILLIIEIIVCLFNWTMAWWRLKETDVITTKR